MAKLDRIMARIHIPTVYCLRTRMVMVGSAVFIRLVSSATATTMSTTIPTDVYNRRGRAVFVMHIM